MDEEYADLLENIDDQIPPLSLGPATKSCPVCLGIRYEQKMFRCMHCGKLICEECRDDLRSQWCKKCAKGPREIRLRFNRIETPADRWVVKIESDLIGDPFYSRERLFDFPLDIQSNHKNPETMAELSLPSSDLYDEDPAAGLHNDTNQGETGLSMPSFSTDNFSSEDHERDDLKNIQHLEISQDASNGVDENDFKADASNNDAVQTKKSIEEAIDAVSSMNWGNALFQSVFPNNSWSDLEDAFRREVLSGGEVRLVLLDLEPEIAVLPWEQFSLPNQPVVSVVRLFSTIPTAVLGPSNGPLKILTLDSHAIDTNNLGSSDGKRDIYLEYNELRAGLSDQLDAGLLHLDVFKPDINNPADGLKESLRKSIQDQHILYFSGSWQITDEPSLELIGRFENEISITLPIDQLSLWLQDSQTQLIVWDGKIFSNGEAKTWTELSSARPSLFLEGNVVGFVALREFIEASSISRFIGDLISNLANHKELEKAISASRRYLKSNALGSNDITWSIPILFCRDWAGSFLNLVGGADQALEIKMPEVIEPFIEEDLSDVRVDEGPKQLSKIVVGLSQRRLQIVLGETDTMPFEVGREAMYSYVNDGERVLRYPRYEPLEDFIYNARRLPNGTRLLLDTAELAVIGSEMDALLDLVTQKDLYLIVTSSVDLEKDQNGVGLLNWLKNNKKFQMVLKEGDFSKESIRRSLLDRVQQAHDNAIISTSIANELNRIANTEETLSDLYTELRLPGQIDRLIHGYLATQSYSSLDVDGLKKIIKDSVSSPDTIRRWFNGELNQSEQVLVMMLTLLPGLPVSQVLPMYHSAVRILRDRYFLNLSVLPIHACLKRWNTYLYERNQVLPSKGKNSYVEFRIAGNANQLLGILRDDYWEWMSEVLTILQQYLIDSLNNPIIDKSIGAKNNDKRILRQAISRALGFIAMRSVDSLQLVIKSLDEIISKANTKGRVHAEWEILVIPGQVISYITEAGDLVLGSSIRSILNEWRQRKDVNFRLAAISSYGQIARRMQPEKLVLPLLSMVRDAQERAERVITQMRKSNTTQNKESLEALQISVDERRAISYSLRFFPPASLPLLIDVYDKLAADYDHETRSRIAIALARSSDNPEIIQSWIDRWASTNNWRVWWTAVASTVVLYETGKIQTDLAKALTRKLVEAADQIAIRQNRASQDLGQDMAWAVMTCFRHADDLADVRPTLRPTINLFLSLLGEKSSTDLVVRGTLTRLSESSDYSLGEARKILLDVFLDQLNTDNYSLDTTARRTAIEILIHVGEIRKPYCQRRLRLLAEFEDFDYRWVLGRSLNTLILDSLGEGGLILQLLLSGDENTLTNTLPYLYQLGSIGSLEKLRAISPFVLSNLGLVRKDLKNAILDNFRAWLATSNGPLQNTAIDGLLGLYRNVPYDQTEQLFDDICSSIEAFPQKTVNYLAGLIPEFDRINPLATAKLEEKLSFRTVSTALGE